MVSRRRLLATTAVTVIPLSGCVTANLDVINQYIDGNEAYQDAETARENGDIKEASLLYKRAEDHFDTAKEAANGGEAEEFSYEAREIARLRAKATENKLEAMQSDEAGQYESVHVDSFLNESERQKLDEYRIREPEAVMRRTRIPESLR